MNLKDFVSQTLTEIINGTIEAQQQTKDTGSIVNPKMKPASSFAGNMPSHGVTFDKQVILPVEFDVALTITEDTKATGKAGISVFKTGLGIEASLKDINQTLNRVKFSVPLALPVGEQ